MRSCTCRGTPPVRSCSRSRTELEARLNESRKARGCGSPGAVAVAAVRRSLPDRPQTVVLGGAAGGAALRSAGRERAATPASVELRVPVHGSVICALVPLFAARGGGLDGVLSAARLSDGLCDRALRRYGAQRTADDDRTALLDLVSVARLRLDGPPEERRCDQPRADVHGPHSSAAGAPEHGLCRVHRYRLLLPAVHDPAAVLESGEARRHAVGSGGGPRRASSDRLPAHHAAVVVARDRGGVAPRLHPCGG